MKRWIIAALMLYSSVAFGQKESNWTTLYHNDQLEFQVMDVNCVNQELSLNTQSRLIRVINKTDQTLSVTWLNEIYYGGKCITCGNVAEYSPKLVLQPSETITGDCNSTRSDMKIFLKDNKGIIKQECSDLKVSNVNATIYSRE